MRGIKEETKILNAFSVALLNGVPIESISKMMGHTNIHSTQLYAKMLGEKVGKDMAPLMKQFITIASLNSEIITLILTIN